MKNNVLSLKKIKSIFSKIEKIEELNDFFEKSKKEESSIEGKENITQIQFEFINNLLKSFWLFNKNNKKIDELVDELYRIVCDIDGDQEVSILLFGKMCGLFMNNIMEIFNPNNQNSSIGAGKKRFIELTTNNN